MKTETILGALKDAAGRLGLAVREEKGNFQGGRCVVAGEPVVMLNKRHLPEVRLSVLARALRSEPVDTVYLRPAVRQALEDLWRQHDDDAAAGGDVPAASSEEAASEEAPREDVLADADG